MWNALSTSRIALPTEYYAKQDIIDLGNDKKKDRAVSGTCGGDEY